MDKPSNSKTYAMELRPQGKPVDTGPSKGSHFEMYGAKELGFAMLREAAQVLAADPELKTRDGVITEQWVRDGHSGSLPFELCLEIAGLDELNGGSLVDAVREELLGNPRRFYKAILSVEKSVRQTSTRYDVSDDDEDEDREDRGGAANDPPMAFSMSYSPWTNSVEVVLHADAPAQAMRGDVG